MLEKTRACSHLFSLRESLNDLEVSLGMGEWTEYERIAVSAIAKAEAAGTPLNVGELEQYSIVSLIGRSTLHRALKALKERGIIEYRRSGPDARVKTLHCAWAAND